MSAPVRLRPAEVRLRGPFNRTSHLRGDHRHRRVAAWSGTAGPARPRPGISMHGLPGHHLTPAPGVLVGVGAADRLGRAEHPSRRGPASSSRSRSGDRRRIMRSTSRRRRRCCWPPTIVQRRLPLAYVNSLSLASFTCEIVYRRPNSPRVRNGAKPTAGGTASRPCWAKRSRRRAGHGSSAAR